jgi:hypothetical protein
MPIAAGFLFLALIDSDQSGGFAFFKHERSPRNPVSWRRTMSVWGHVRTFGATINNDENEPTAHLCMSFAMPIRALQKLGYFVERLRSGSDFCRLPWRELLSDVDL